MNDANLKPISSDERIEIIDVLRGLAISGILIGNMQWFSGYGMVPPELEAHTPLYNQITHFLVHFFIEGKFYSVFSFLFGFGFALQISRAEQRGDTRARVFKRRLLWLLLIGALHATLLWAGDILSVYALMGFFLLLFRRKSDEALLKWAAALVIVPVLTYLLLFGLWVALVPPEAMAGFDRTAMWYQNVEAVAHGTYLSIVTKFNSVYLAGRWIGLILQMRLPKILAMFLLGLYAFRKGYFQNLAMHKPFIRKVLAYGLIFGMIGNIAMATLAGEEGPIPPSGGAVVGVFGYAFGVPALALAYIALVSLLWLRGGPIRNLLNIVAPVGRMALTNYLLQTVTCLTIFYGFGFGRFGSIGAGKATLIALTIFACQIVLSTVWLKYFNYGPMEWVWRQLTYRRRLALVRPSGTLAEA